MKQSGRSRVAVLEEDVSPGELSCFEDQENRAQVTKDPIKYVKLGPSGTEPLEDSFLPREVLEILDSQAYIAGTRGAIRRNVGGRYLLHEDTTLASSHEALPVNPVTHETMLQGIVREGWMPSWESYHSSQATSAWFRLCRGTTSGAATYESSVSFFQALQPLLYSGVLRPRLHDILRQGMQILSLGIGNGTKDPIILKALAQRGIRDVDHVLVDASAHMLDQALGRFVQSDPRVLPQNLSLEVRYMLFEQMKDCPAERRTPDQMRIVLLLGLTVGNFKQGEGGIFELLRDSTQVGDVLILDYQKLNGQGSESIRQQYDIRPWKGFVVQPLKDIIALRFDGNIPDLPISRLLGDPARCVQVRFVDEIIPGESSGIGAVEFILTEEATSAFEQFVQQECNMPKFILPRPFNVYRSCKYKGDAFENKLKEYGFDPMPSAMSIGGQYGYNLLMAIRS